MGQISVIISRNPGSALSANQQADRIHHFLELGYFKEGTAEYGIALKVADQGEGSLVGNQFFVWRERILPVISNPLNDEERYQLALDADREAEWNKGR